LKEYLDQFAVLLCVDEETNIPRRVDEWERKRQPPHIDLWHKVRNDAPLFFREGGRAGKQRCRMAVIAHA